MPPESETGPPAKPTAEIKKKHPFFMAPAERAAQRLSEQISASNALNRAIQVQINLVSEEEEEFCNYLSAGTGTVNEAEQQQTNQPQLQTVQQQSKCSFFQKRTKLNVNNPSANFKCKLKRISSTDPPPFPLQFQLTNYQNYPRESAETWKTFNNNNFTLQIVAQNLDEGKGQIVPLSELIRLEYSNIDADGLKELNKTIRNRSLNSLTTSNNNNNSKMLRTILNEIELAETDKNPILFLLTGPPGSGKTRLIEDLSEKFSEVRLITIDSSSNLVRNSKTFETLLTTLSHKSQRREKIRSSEIYSDKSSKSNEVYYDTPDYTSNYTPNIHCSKCKFFILFDEVEIAFENDRGYWTALSSFLQSAPAKSVPIFITSNAPISFLQSIIKLPDHVQILNTYDEGCDFRSFNYNTDLISRLHRVDTSFEYEHLVLTTGYQCCKESETNREINNSKLIISESLKWNNLVENVHIHPNQDIFQYIETSSQADLLLSTKDSSEKTKLLDPDRIQCEAEDLLGSNNSSGLLYTCLPEIYEEADRNCFDIARELIERTITTFESNEDINSNTSNTAFSNTCDTSTDNTNFHSHWKNLSKKMSRRFYDYTQSLQPLQIWQSELVSHVSLIEQENFRLNGERIRRKRAYYRYLGEELFNVIINKAKCE